MVHLWRGFHHPHLKTLLQNAWEKNELVVLVPPTLKDFSFLRLFARVVGEQETGAPSIQFHGDWASLPVLPEFKISASEKTILEQAVLGVFTSGTSSGIPRLVLYSKENVTSSLEGIRELYEVDRIERIFVYPQATHTFGLVLGYMHALLNGLELDFCEGAYSRKAHEHWLSRVTAKTLTLGTPTHFIDLIQYVQALGKTPPASYSAIVGGARVTQELWSQLRQVLQIREPSVGYGATEASPGVTHLPPGIPPREDGDIGYALRGVAVNLVADEGLVFRGRNTCLAVFERNELRPLPEVMLKDSVQSTLVDGRPRFTFVGRTDLLVNRGGMKISLEVVEGKIASHFACKCMAFSFYDERLGEDLGVMVQISSDKPAERAAMAEQITKLLSTDMGLGLSVNNIVFGDIPLNANAKFDRKECLKIFLRSRPWELPVSVELVKPFLPHRASAVWVDRILDAKDKFGVVEVVLKRAGNYFGPDKFRESSCIEFVAQAYGYVIAMTDILGIKEAPKATKTFIAEAKNVEFYFDDLNFNLEEGHRLQVQVHCTHDFGVLKLVEGKVHCHINGEEKLLASLALKLYCGE